MPLTKFKLSSIADDGITSQKLAHDLDFDGQFVRVPHGTTAQRPSSPAAGYLRFNTTLGTLEQYNTNTSNWAAIDSPPVITSVAYAGAITAADPAGGDTITITGSNFKSGLTVTVGGTAAASVSFTNTTTITFVTPVKTAGDYDVAITNPNGLTATSTNGISFNGIPSWTTSAGQLGSTLLPSQAISTITIVASEPDGGAIGYSITTGALPAGLSLGASNGQITGTPTAPTSTTTTNFTVTATDDENQTTPRAFNIQVYRPLQSYSITNSMINEKQTDSYLHKTPSSAGNRRKWTFATWIKLSEVPTSGYFPRIFSSGVSGGRQTEIALTQTGQIRVEDRDTSLRALHDSEMTVRDVTGWGHLVVQVDIANATQSERTKIYWNGVQITRWASQTQYSDTSYESFINSTNQHRIGESVTYAGNRLGGYLAETHFIDGTVVAPTVFGEDYNDTWVPKQVTGLTYGTNGFHMNYQTSSSLGDDVSGQTNDYAEQGTQYQSVDTPTNNFPTVNVNNARTSGITVREGGLFPLKSSARFLVGTTATASKDQGGKFYCEIQLISQSSPAGGVAIGFTPNGSIPDPDSQGDLQFTGGWRARIATGNNNSSWAIQGGSSVVYAGGNVFAIGDWVGIGIDFDNNFFKIWDESGTLQLNGDISSRALKETAYTLAMGCESGGQTIQSRLNFGATAFQRTGGIPSGFKTFQASQLPALALDPVIDDGAQKHFKPLTWVGNNASSRAITGLGFTPDIVWAKVTDATYQHMFMTSPIGGNKVGHTQSTAAFDTNFAYGYLTSFDSDGFTVQSGSSSIENLNETNKNYVSWNWKCGGAPTATNSANIGAAPTSGSVMIDGVASSSAVAGTLLTKKLTANTQSGVSTSIYVGNGTGSGSFAHGLGKKPRFVLHKRINASDSWIAHWQIGTGVLSCALNDSLAVGTNDTTYGTHTTDVVTMISSSGARNTANEEHVAMCFAEVPGFSSIGQLYGTGNLGERSTFVECGFRPAFIMIKSVTNGQWWVIHDSARENGHNPINNRIFPNDAAVSDTNGNLEFHTTGFKFYGGAENLSNVYAYYVAFADQPKAFANAGLKNI
jgi:hypothetical protein